MEKQWAITKCRSVESAGRSVNSNSNQRSELEAGTLVKPALAGTLGEEAVAVCASTIM